MTSECVEKFLKCVMKNDYHREESESLVKFYNKNFDVLMQKRKDGKKDSCIVIDKRSKPIIYNDVSIALEKLCV